MKLDAFIIGIAIFSFFIVGGSLVLNDVFDNYDVNASVTGEGSNFSSVYNTINETYELSQDIKEHTLEAELEGADESWESMVKGSYSGIRMVKNSFTLVGDILDEIAKVVGIPAWMIKFAITILTVSILFAIIYLVFRVGKGT